MKLFISLVLLSMALLSTVKAKRHPRWAWKDPGQVKPSLASPPATATALETEGGGDGAEVSNNTVTPTTMTAIIHKHASVSHGEGTKTARHNQSHKTKPQGNNTTTDNHLSKDSRRMGDMLTSSDPDACRPMRCKKREVCMVIKDTMEAECVAKKLLRQRKKNTRVQKSKSKVKSKKKQNSKAKQTRKLQLARTATNEDVRRAKVHRVKSAAHNFKRLYDKRMKHKLHHMTSQADDAATEGRNKKVTDDEQEENAVVEEANVCSALELREMGRRLLDWFKLLQDEAKHPRRSRNHQIAKRNSKKKELHEDDECICQAPVSWQFLKLDADSDGRLAVAELRTLEQNGYEHCVTPFIESCDHDKDARLTEREWCCCFADVLPPCLAAMQKIPSVLERGEPVVMPGAYVPQCDDDGFFNSTQCHSGIGYCWCVDRQGTERDDTRTRGSPQCDAEKQLAEVRMKTI